MTTAIILSGGIGSRVKNKDCPKQYIEVSGRPIIWYVLHTVLHCLEVDDCIVVAEEQWRDLIQKQYEDILPYCGRKRVGLSFADPGETRQLSVFNGLTVVDRMAGCSDDDLVVIIDAARPKMSTGLLATCIKEAGECDGAIPVLPMKDTIYQSEDGGRISKLLERNKLFAGQAPEAFRFRKYLEANRALFPERIRSIVGSTEPAILAGMEIRMIPGDEQNDKITTDEDLKRFREELGEGQLPEMGKVSRTGRRGTDNERKNEGMGAS